MIRTFTILFAITTLVAAETTGDCLYFPCGFYAVRPSYQAKANQSLALAMDIYNKDNDFKMPAIMVSLQTSLMTQTGQTFRFGVEIVTCKNNEPSQCERLDWTKRLCSFQVGLDSEGSNSVSYGCILYLNQRVESKYNIRY
ncbi:uncharacterized protein LOC141858029 [Brevipalpus obovatus]|uniref:uncharacterized protein LOC141858029 n=1 Tax=Brevipalpus obovatus TaxID=246614 RepID=UPI003D9EED1B